MKKSVQIILCLSVLGLASCTQTGLEHSTKPEAEAASVFKDNQQRITKHSIEKRQRAILSQAFITANMITPADASFYEQRIQLAPQNQEKYPDIKENSVKLVTEKPVSTFSIDVDTASYTNVRRILNQGNSPQYNAVRVEEFINYFSYDYPLPSQNSEQPFSVYTEIAPSPFNDDKHLLHIGIQGKTIDSKDRPASNLVFLIDVSGSMRNANKIGLLKNSLKMLTKQLGRKDIVSLVVYAGAAGVVLKPTQGDNHYAISDALDRLSAGGSTNGGAGIIAAYNLAKESFIEGGVNRVIIATDGDFNLGTVNQQALKNLIEQKRKLGISLSVLGFGMGNYNDALMQTLAQNGNGNAYYIDTLQEARKVLVEELSATLMTIAKDVKIQVEFNPNTVSEYRLIGYETRALKREDFNNDKIDAGEIGAGHTVTALYEVSFVEDNNKMIDTLRYQNEKNVPSTSRFKDESEYTDELVYIRLRYKLPKQNHSELIEIAVKKSEVKASFLKSSDNFRFSSAVAGFGQLLRGGKYLSAMNLEQVILLAQNAKGEDKHGYRGEFINLVKLSDALSVH